MYAAATETIELLRSESGPLIVSFDSFLTVTGSPSPPFSISCALLSLLIPLASDLHMCPPLPLRPYFPGLSILQYQITSLNLLRAWEVWLKLSKEICFSLDYLQNSLPRAMESGFVLFLVEREAAGLSVEPDIRVIDLRKLRKAIDQNSVVLLASAEDLHSTIKRVKSTALEAIHVLEALSERADLQEKVLELRLEDSKDPAEVWRRQERDIRTLAQACLAPYSPSVDYQ
jgi:hypothetical protein